MDGAILVVSATDGPMPQTREHILLARQVSSKKAAARRPLHCCQQSSRGARLRHACGSIVVCRVPCLY